jgi:hypothetical protein
MARFQDSFGDGFDQMQQVAPIPSTAPVDEEQRQRRLAEMEAIKSSLRIDTDVLEVVRQNRHSWVPTPQQLPHSTSFGASPESGPSPVPQFPDDLPIVPATHPISFIATSPTNRTLRLINNYNLPQRTSSVVMSPFSADVESGRIPPREPPTNPFE